MQVQFMFFSVSDQTRYYIEYKLCFMNVEENRRDPMKWIVFH